MISKMLSLPEDVSRTASFQYIKHNPLHELEKPYRLNKFTPPDGLAMTNIEFETHSDVGLTDLRGYEDSLDLERDAFKFINYPSAVEPENIGESLQTYCEESIQLIKDQLNPDRVICYEVLYRHAEAKTAESKNKNSAPITMVHIDHTTEGGKFRIKHHLTNEEISEYDNGSWRWRIVNIWRPLCPVVQTFPLAFLDPKTVANPDVVDTDQVGPHYSGEISYLKHSKDHRWYWLSNQTTDEVITFVCFDTHPPSSALNCAPHASFVIQDAPEDAIPRESIELRFIVITKL
ncbi:hypothetical protein BP6252_11269 [Coleophoma cylindrospora]|uniref:Uncharacterized protein n=1 Tax=Coleophoma cylindrospora TaxID=1849047 RepID=A0A3D8QQG7_9HELO|nr:hypothetical protein BP6252_11269 [Coleophoma cylindrospora]